MQLRIRGSALCVQDGKLLVVWLRDPATGTLYKLPPGGAVEKRESPWEAAQRELLEETGYRAKLEKSSEKVVEYPFVWNGQVHACRTHFFLGKIVGDARPVSCSEKEVEGTEWLPLSKLEKEWGFHKQLCAALMPIVLDADSKKPAPLRKKA